MILGVDCGLSGAWALLTDYGRLITVGDMPAADGAVSAHLLADAFVAGWRATLDWPNPPPPSDLGLVTAVVEVAGSMPGQGVASTWKFGRATGVVEGVIGGLGWPLHTVTPAKWKKALGLGKDKGASRAMAARLWPDHAALFARVKDDGRAEAALIAEWWRRQK